MRHLGTNDFQEMLDGERGLSAGESASHLESCPRCRENYARYRRFYKCLGSDSVPPLSPDFAGRVMNAVMQQPRAEKELIPNPSVLIWSFALISCGAVIFLVNWQGAIKTLLSGKVGYLKWLDAILSVPGQVLPQFLNTPAFIIGGTVLLAVALLDYLIRHRSNRPSTFVI